MFGEVFHRRDQAIHVLFRKPHAGGRFAAPERHDRFRRAAAAEGDHGRSAGVGFHGDDAEVFFSGKEQRATTTQVLADRFIRLPTEELNGRPGQAA